jgi:hypothetical protein
MRLIPVTAIAFVLLAMGVLAQTQPVIPMKQIMLDLIHPAANDILLFVNRGATGDERDWATMRRSAVTLAESGSLLLNRGTSGDGVWASDARRLLDVGMTAYRAAQARDREGLARLTSSLDDSCTVCHVHFRPNVFRRDGGSR